MGQGEQQKQAEFGPPFHGGEILQQLQGNGVQELYGKEFQSEGLFGKEFDAEHAEVRVMREMWDKRDGTLEAFKAVLADNR